MTCNLILPPNIKKLESKVEELAGFQITYILDPSIAGNLMSEFENGLPIIRYRGNMDVEGVAHELLHLKLQTQGYHSLKSWPEKRFTSLAALILLNVVQHHIIFPILEGWGFNPKKQECAGTQELLLGLLELKLPLDTPCLCPPFAMLYVRGMLDCNDTDLHHCFISFFDNKLLVRAREMAVSLINRIKLFNKIAPGEYNSTLNDCISILGLAGDIEIATHI